MRFIKRFGPVLAIEILLPGGTLMALLLYFARRRGFFSSGLSILGPAVRLFT